MELVRAVLAVNERQPARLVDLLKKHLDPEGKTVAVLGLAFKADTDDVRESRSIPLIRKLREEGAVVRAYDPMAADNMRKILPDIEYCESVREALNCADACIVATDWEEFADIDVSPMRRKLVLEGRRVLKNRDGFEYEGICW
jgi:UDPglucose 6-dehydrogenase